MFRPPPLRRTFAASLRDAESSSSATRASALRDLGGYAGEARVPVVRALERALSDGSAEVRATALVGLADARAVEALPSLLVAMEDDDAYVRQMALTAVGEVGDGRARERLRRALSDPRPEMRFQAVIAFCKVAPDEALDICVERTGDADHAIRYIAVRCAEEQLGEGAVLHAGLRARLGELLDDGDPSVRVAAAILLGRSQDARARKTLLDVVSGDLGPVDAEDEAAAVELAGELGLMQAVPHLERRAFGFFPWSEGRFGWQAMVSLAKLGHERARARIVRDLSSWSRDRRTLAVAAAGIARLVEARPLIAAMKGDARLAEPSAVSLTLDTLGAVPAEHEGALS